MIGVSVYSSKDFVRWTYEGESVFCDSSYAVVSPQAAFVPQGAWRSGTASLHQNPNVVMSALDLHDLSIWPLTHLAKPVAGLLA